MAHIPRIKGPRVKAAAKPQSVDWALDGIAVSAICLGAATVTLALFVCFGAGDPRAASFILAATAGMIGLFVHATAERPNLG